MTWLEFRENYMAKAYDIMVFSAMLFGGCMLVTGCVVIPLLIFKWLSWSICK